MDINQYSEQYFKFLTENFVNSITAQISHKVIDNVTALVNQYDVKSEIDRKVKETVDNAIASYQTTSLNGMTAVAQHMVDQYRSQSQRFLDSLTADIKTKVIDDFKAKVNAIDIGAMIHEQCNTVVMAAIENNTLKFQDRSIPGSAVDYSSMQIRAENILPGIISKFTSTGIEDLSSGCQVTITDQFTILENKLVAQDVEVRGQMSFNGSVDSKFTDHVAGLAVAKIEATYGEGTFDQYVHRVLFKLNEEGLDATKIHVQGGPIVENSSLSNTITNSNLRKVGLLSELEVAGEVLLDDTLYVRSGRIGVNTNEPVHVLDVWDQEVQLVAGKRQKDTVFLGTIKNQALVIGAAGQDQLVLDANGNISLSKVKIGQVSHSSAAWQPTDNRQLGEIVWNEQPNIGAPIGWVSLGGARWAKFGTITE